MPTGGLSDLIFVFIVNPNAGNHKMAKRARMLIDRFLELNPLTYIIELTKGPGDATRIADKYAKAYGSKCRFVSVGGDGTLNEVVNGMADSGAQLTIIPAGSGNDFIKSIYPLYKKNQKMTYELISEFLTGSPKPVDLASVNGRYFLNIASIGFDADVVFNATRFKKTFIPARLAYYASIFFSLVNLRSKKVSLTADDRVLQKDVALIAVANGKYYGGGIMPAPTAEVDDGLLDLCIVDKITRLKVIRFFSKYKAGTHGVLKEVTFGKSPSVTIESDEDFRLNIDGEILISRKAVFSYTGRKINFVI